MRLGILSDIHANPFALRAVLKDLEDCNVELVLCAGDFFGYYPWAQETFVLLQHLNLKAVLGNHDRLVLDTLNFASCPGESDKPVLKPAYYEAAALNGRVLSLVGRRWIDAMPLTIELIVGSWSIKMVHGTPDDPLEGRFYPDSTASFWWFPGKKEILILGHTHYPLIRILDNGGFLLNPGSVGQPRDGDPRPSWLFLDTDLLESSIGQPILHRVVYDQFKPMAILKRENWPQPFINALNKTSRRPLHQEPPI